MRPICPVCNQRPRAIAYHQGEKTYYQNRCNNCLKANKKLKPAKPKWQLDGYKKKAACDRCGFKARYAAQLLVYHIDGNLNNSNPRNLKTVCLNCTVDIKKSDLPWGRGDLEPDS